MRMLCDEIATLLNGMTLPQRWAALALANPHWKQMLA